MQQAQLFFSDHFKVAPEVLERYGAFNVSVVSDLPLFVDPFLLFNSEKKEYQQLHEDILKYLKYLRSISTAALDPAIIKDLYRFKEVKQNWFGYVLFGNAGSGLGNDFAVALHGALNTIFSNFGSEAATKSAHLEKLCLIKPGVGKDNISDFTTNLIKPYLLRYTEKFAKKHLDPNMCETFRVARAEFNYETESWATRDYYLPRLRDDFILLTPEDMLTRDNTWINHPDMIRQFWRLPESVSDEIQRGRINMFFKGRLTDDPTPKERIAAAIATIREFPELIDAYIAMQEDNGDAAQSLSAEQRREIEKVFIGHVRAAATELDASTDFYDLPWTSYEEALKRVLLFKDYIENKDGYRLINRTGSGFSREQEVQLFFGLIWCLTDFDVNREPNNGRGPVDFKISYGSGDKSLIEFKLASSTSLERNLEHQVKIYEAANGTKKSIKVIVCYTDKHQERVAAILKKLGLQKEESIVVINARSDDKPSASKATKH
ncbi:hypothetical protein BH09ACT5_BH09ACT5_01260 [soil metagenome]